MCDTNTSSVDESCGCGCGCDHEHTHGHGHSHGEGHECAGHKKAEEIKRQPRMKSAAFEAGMFIYSIAIRNEVTQISGELELECDDPVSVACFASALKGMGDDIVKSGGAVGELFGSVEWDEGDARVFTYGSDISASEARAQIDEDTVAKVSLIAYDLEAADVETIVLTRLEKIL